MGNKGNTFNEVADRKGLVGSMKTRFVKYMTIRWGRNESTQCQSWYADEWADRFLGGDEYNMSDSIGQEILKSIDRNLKEG